MSNDILLWILGSGLTLAQFAFAFAFNHVWKEIKDLQKKMDHKASKEDLEARRSDDRILFEKVGEIKEQMSGIERSVLHEINGIKTQVAVLIATKAMPARRGAR